MADLSVHSTALSALLYPSPSLAAIKQLYVGKRIQDIQPPAVILDVAVIRWNCEAMLDSTSKLGVGFRAHVKTHKTTELAKLQVGETSRSVKLVASTVAEIENLVPWLLECIAEGKQVNVLYGVPVTPSSIPRLASVARLLGAGSVGLFVDHPTHTHMLEQVDAATWPGRIPVWTNIDIGYHREGVSAGSEQLMEIAKALASSRRLSLAGFYTHMGHSYSVSSPDEALDAMTQELEGLEKGAIHFLETAKQHGYSDDDAAQITLSLGASPTSTSIQNLTEGREGAEKYRATIEKVKQSFSIEFHAGVYPVMDLQQLATRARPARSAADPSRTILSFDDLGMRTLVEVASVYSDRTKPEALIVAGSIVLGREPCKSYTGWGVVSPWPAKTGPHYDPESDQTGWIVGRISQEHGVLTWEGDATNIRSLRVGEKLLVWPNHACIAGVNFGWYLVVDSRSGEPDVIEDVWLRWRGW